MTCKALPVVGISTYMEITMKFKFNKLISFLYLLILISPIKAYSIEKQNFEFVHKFKIAVLKGDKVEIGKLILFPLLRKYPIPSINTPKDFIKRFDDIFDDKLIRLIKDSDIQKDWQEVGWRGIMLHNGDIWMNYDGRIIAINYQSEAEKALKYRLIEAERKKLHKSIREFKEPVLDWRTERFRVRIDKIGEYKYRYASWPKDKPIHTEPELILNNGECIYEGSGGNHYYEFENGDYTYKLIVFLIGKDDTPGTLKVLNRDKLLLSEDIIETMIPY